MSEGQLYSRCSACEFVGLGRLTWEYVGFLDLFVNVETNSQLVKIVRAHHLKNPIDYAYCHGQHYLYTDIEEAKKAPKILWNPSSYPDRVHRGFIGTLFVAKTGEIAHMTLSLSARKLF